MKLVNNVYLVKAIIQEFTIQKQKKQGITAFSDQQNYLVKAITHKNSRTQNVMYLTQLYVLHKHNCLE